MFRSLLTVIGWSLLLTLPLTFLPLLTSTISGISFAFWHNRHIETNTAAYLSEIHARASDWGVGGDVPSFRQWQDTNNDFGVMRINSDDWTRKLGFVLPEQYANILKHNEVTIEKSASLTTLKRNTSPSSPDSAKPREQWLWLTWYGFPDFFPWDRSFVRAIFYANAHPPKNESGFFIAQCSGSAEFLCGVWGTRPYALVHFLVEEEEILGVEEEEEEEEEEEGLTYGVPSEDLRRVTVRIIEFPLQDVWTGLPENVFLGDDEQVRAVMGGEGLYEQFEPYEEMAQLMHHFAEYENGLWNAKGTVRSYLDRVDDWIGKHIAEPMGLDGLLDGLHDIVFVLVGRLTGELVIAPMNMLWELGEAYLARPSQAERILGRLEDFDPEPANLMDGVFAGFLAKLPGMVEAHRSAAKDEGEPIVTGG
ncbi:hypothetical protein LTR62_007398 [Meristemomyces frigidus]|uniref:Uncharacterized protein n=1 Tax=Meristemomyces frigidus TaxID=1508187 RepID=A0AAN7TNH6_9PEZI|nr:hypothetical protein LTR62_007398 [Meristemomyces frigidus]